MIFKTAAEVKNHAPTNASFNFSLMERHLKENERFVYRVVGKDFYDEIDASYQTASSGGQALTTKEEKVLDLMRAPLAKIALFKAIPELTLQVTDTGIHQPQSENIQPASWQATKDLQRSLLEKAYNAIDPLLDYLRENLDTFTTYRDSDEYAANMQHFIYDAEIFTKIVNIGGSHHSYITMRNIMERVEEFRIKPLIGDTLWSTLKTAVKDQDEANLTADNKTTLDLIRKSVAHLTMSDAIEPLFIKISEDGYRIYDNDLLGELSREDGGQRNKLEAIWRTTGENYLKQLEDHITTEEEEEEESDSNIHGLF